MPLILAAPCTIASIHRPAKNNIPIEFVGEGLDPPGGMIFHVPKIFGKFYNRKVLSSFAFLRSLRITLLIAFYFSTFHYGEYAGVYFAGGSRPSPTREYEIAEKRMCCRGSATHPSVYTIAKI